MWQNFCFFSEFISFLFNPYRKKNMLTIYQIISFFCMLLLAECKEIADANLLVKKSILNSFYAESIDLIIKYDVYNVGESDAYNVIVKDTYEIDDLKLKSDSSELKWSKIVHKTNVSAVIIYEPLQPKIMNISVGLIQYEQEEGGSTRQIGRSNKMPQIAVMAFNEYSRQYASHKFEWLVFFGLCILSLFFPYMLWKQSVDKYEGIQKKL
ncbi:hypothetical protein SNEBB_011321 [Seison nebaliae]|nr:hypothetical protein SNEBB_011321 [Seison nebaliae]